MFFNAKNHHIKIEDDITDFISFGTGKKNLVIIPGVGDGIKTAKGLAIPFALMYRLFAKDFTQILLAFSWKSLCFHYCPAFSSRNREPTASNTPSRRSLLSSADIALRSTPR